MTELHSLALLFGVGIAAGFLNVMAGGGSTITLPVLIFLGLDPSIANGTNRVAILIQNVSAVQSFKNENQSEFKKSFKLSLFTLPGAILGAILAVRISGELFQIILAVVMIGIVINMLVPKKKVELGSNSARVPWYVYLAMTGIGFYGGFIQVGVGFILMAALHNLMGLTLVKVNMHKVFIVLIYTIPALAVFIFTDNVNWLLGLTLAAGNALGAWWSAKLSVRKGDKVVKIVLMIAIIVMSLKLLSAF